MSGISVMQYKLVTAMPRFKEINMHLGGILNLEAHVNSGRFKFLGVQPPSTWHTHVDARHLGEAFIREKSHIHLPLRYIPVKASDSNPTTPRGSAPLPAATHGAVFPPHGLCGRGASLAPLHNEMWEEPVFCTSTYISAHSVLQQVP